MLTWEGKKKEKKKEEECFTPIVEAMQSEQISAKSLPMTP